MHWPLRRSVIAVAVASALVTLLLTIVPSTRLVSDGRHVGIAIETAAMLIGLLAAYLVAGRFRISRRLDELVLASGLAVVAIANGVFVVLPSLVDASVDHRLGWAAIVWRIGGVVLITTSAFLPERTVERSTRALRRAVAMGGGVMAVSAVVALLVGDAAAPFVAGGLRPDGGIQLEAHAEPGAIALLLCGALLYAAAAIGFLRRAERRPDTLTSCMAIASVFGAAARVNYAIYPSVFASQVYAGDVFRLGFYVLVAVCAAREIQRHLVGAAERERLEERRRLARDLHDGLAVELAAIRREASALEGTRDDEVARRLQGAAARAQLELRLIGAALDEPLDVPLPEALGTAVRQTAAREQLHVGLVVDADVALTRPVAEDLIRIACEAVANAGRHRAAGRARVALRRAGGGLVLEITDDGRGFDPAGQPESSGLQRVRDRVEALGGRLAVISAPGAGTSLRVDL